MDKKVHATALRRNEGQTWCRSAVAWPFTGWYWEHFGNAML